MESSIQRLLALYLDSFFNKYELELAIPDSINEIGKNMHKKQKNNSVLYTKILL